MRGCRDRIVVGFTTTCAISAYRLVVSSNPVHGEVYLIQHYVIRLRLVGGFFLVLWFPPPIKLTATI